MKMQLKFIFKTDSLLYLPLGHHDILQGFIYNKLKNNSKYAAFLHDVGYYDNAHNFKMFVFSTLKGDHHIDNSRIVYTNNLYLEIRSPMDEFCNILLHSIQDNSSAELNNQPIHLYDWCISDKQIHTTSIDIKMASPLTLSTTYYKNDKKKTRYLSPSDNDFNCAFIHNTKSKYKAFYKKDLSSDLQLSPINVGLKDKYVTKFKNHIFINAWNGTYRLDGDSSLLSFLYDTGIGSRNSQGFGMFDIVEK